MYSDIKNLLSVKYERDARSYEKTDCYGICYLYNRDVLNKKIPEFANYDKDQNNYTRVSLGKECPGDIIMFNIKGYPIHVGVIVQKGTMLHIMENSKAAIESYKSAKWEKRIDSIWRYEGTK